jgi:ribonucleoside-diphosphate reductase alpha chain
MNEVLSYFNGNELAANVWTTKYALRKNGKLIETTPNDMHARMADEFARIEEKYGGRNQIYTDHIVRYFANFSQLIPQGSVMAVLGNKHQIGSLSNCVVLPKIHDSYGGIMYTDQQLAQIMKRRCGGGIDISTLRPSGTHVSNAAQSSTGAVSFMHRFSHTTREVAQDGRRGALMITMDIRHPEAEQFALVKQDLTKVTGANISLKLIDEFMERVEKGQDFCHRFPVEGVFDESSYSEAEDSEYGELETWANALVKKVKARDLWQTITKCAHATAEPGLIFWDRQHRYSPSSLYPGHKNISTNPCSEIAMPNDSCRLMAANIFSCVINPFTPKAAFNFDQWYGINYDGMRLMDDLVDLEIEAIDRILDKIRKDKEPIYIKQVEIDTWLALRDMAVKGRRTGFGFTALADALAALGYKYDSTAALDFVDSMMKVKLGAELDSMMDMAEERGAFPDFDAKLEAQYAEEDDTFFYFLKNTFPERWERMQKVGRRNISWSTVAPTGTLSLLAQLSKEFYGTTSGMEPLFAVLYWRRKKITPSDKDARVDFVDEMGDKWTEFPVFHEGFKMWWVTQATHHKNSEDALEELESFDREQIDHLIKTSPYGDSTAPEIDWMMRIDMQSVIQKYISHSISSTINLPSDVSEQEVSDIYFAAWKAGLKGITVYRDKCRAGVLITEKKEKRSFKQHDAPKRPKQLYCDIYTAVSKGDKYNVVVGLMDGNPYEVFAMSHFTNSEHGSIHKQGRGKYNLVDEKGNIYVDFLSGLTDEEAAITRLISTSLRHGANIKYVVEQLGKVEGLITGFTKVIARTLKKYVPEEELTKTKCKDCGGTNLKFEEGCVSCNDCGSSKCS